PDTTATVSLDVNMAFRRNLNDNHGNSHRHRDEGTQVQESENNSNSSSGNRNFRYNFYVEKKLPTSKILLSFRQNTNIQQSENTNNRSSFSRYYLFNDSTVNQGILQLTNGNNRSINNNFNIQIPIGEQLNWDAYARYNWELNRNIEEIDSKINADAYSSRNDVANNKQGRF